MGAFGCHCGWEKLLRPTVCGNAKQLRTTPPTRAGVLDERQRVGDLTHSICLGSTCLLQTWWLRACLQGVDSALAENSQPPEGEQPRALWSGSDFPFLVECLPHWLCLGFSSMLLRFLRLYNYYLIRGSGLNWLSRRIMVMQFPAKMNFLHLAQGGRLPLPWTDAESGSYCSELDGLGDIFLHQNRVWGGGLQSSVLIAFSYLI